MVWVLGWGEKTGANFFSQIFFFLALFFPATMNPNNNVCTIVIKLEPSEQQLNSVASYHLPRNLLHPRCCGIFASEGSAYESTKAMCPCCFEAYYGQAVQRQPSPASAEMEIRDTQDMREDYYDAERQQHLVREATPKKPEAAASSIPAAPQKPRGGSRKALAVNFLKRPKRIMEDEEEEEENEEKRSRK